MVYNFIYLLIKQILIFYLCRLRFEYELKLRSISNINNDILNIIKCSLMIFLSLMIMWRCDYQLEYLKILYILI